MFNIKSFLTMKEKKTRSFEGLSNSKENPKGSSSIFGENGKVEMAFPVYRTNDLTLFVGSDFNRDLVANEKLRKSLLEKGFDPTMPIKVVYDKKTGKLFITDGHHRHYFCCQIAKENEEDLTNSSFEVTFIVVAVVNDAENPDKNFDFGRLVRLTNQTARAWNPDAYMKSYAMSGFPAYTVIYDNLITKFNMTSKQGIEKPRFRAGTPVIASTHGRVHTQDPKFKDGLLNIEDVDIDFAAWLLNYVLNKGIVGLFSKRRPQEILVKFFTYFYPLFTDEEKALFDSKISKYSFPYLTKSSSETQVLEELASLPSKEYNEIEKTFSFRPRFKKTLMDRAKKLVADGNEWFEKSKGIIFKSDMSMYPPQRENRTVR